MPPAEPRIEPMTVLDLLPVLAIELRTNPSPWPIASFWSEFLRPGACRLVARRPDRTVAGFVLGRLAADELEVLAIAVAPGAQRRGLGRRLLGAVLDAADRARARSVHLEVRRRNRPARALYAALGFIEVGRRGQYYPDDRDDAILLRRPGRGDAPPGRLNPPAAPADEHGGGAVG